MTEKTRLDNERTIEEQMRFRDIILFGTSSQKLNTAGEEAVELTDSILQSKKISVLDVDDKEGKTLKASMAKFKKYHVVRGLSFTDCTTLSIQEMMKIGF